MREKAFGYHCKKCNRMTVHNEPHETCSNPKCMGLGLRPADSPLPDNSHYKVGAIDPCQYVEAMGDAEYRGACVLNILKYITRYPYKGTPLMDLAKARDYLSKLIEHEEKKGIVK